MKNFVCGNSKEAKVQYKVFLSERKTEQLGDYLNFDEIAYTIKFKHNNKIFEGTVIYSVSEEQIVNLWLENQARDKEEAMDTWHKLMSEEEYVIAESIRQNLF